MSTVPSMLTNLPTEVLGQILVGDVSHQAIRLWICGCVALNIKLAHGGVKEIHLEDRKFNSKSRWPKLVSRAFKGLQRLHLSRGIELLEEPEKIAREIMRLPSGMRVISLEFADAEEAFVQNGDSYISIMMGDDDPYGDDDSTYTADVNTDDKDAADDRFYTVGDPELFSQLDPSKRVAELIEESRVHRIWSLALAFPQMECLSIRAETGAIFESDLYRLPPSLRCLRLIAGRPSFCNLVLSDNSIPFSTRFAKATELAESLPRNLVVFHWGGEPESSILWPWIQEQFWIRPPSQHKEQYRNIGWDLSVLKALPEDLASINSHHFLHPLLQQGSDWSKEYTDSLPRKLLEFVSIYTQCVPSDILRQFPPSLVRLHLRSRYPTTMDTLQCLPVTLTHLWLSPLEFRNEDLESALAREPTKFTRFTNLQHLNISDSPMHFLYMKCLPNHLKSLSVSFTSMQQQLGMTSLRDLRATFSDWHSLETLVLDFQDMNMSSLQTSDFDALPKTITDFEFKSRGRLIDPSLIVGGLNTSILHRLKSSAPCTPSTEWQISWFKNGRFLSLVELKLLQVAQFKLEILAHLPPSTTSVSIKEDNGGQDPRYLRKSLIKALPFNLKDIELRLPIMIDNSEWTFAPTVGEASLFPPHLVSLSLPLAQISIDWTEHLPNKLQILKIEHLRHVTGPKLTYLPRGLRRLEALFFQSNGLTEMDADFLPPHLSELITNELNLVKALDNRKALLRRRGPW